MAVSLKTRTQHTLNEILIRLISLEDTMALDVQAIKAEIEENTSLVSSLVTATNAIVAELRALSAAGGADQATLDALALQIETDSNTVLRSALANTEAGAVDVPVDVPADEPVA